MKRTILVAATLGLLTLGGCGGGSDPPATPPPSTGGTPPAGTGTTADFNALAAQLAGQRDAASERTTPILVDTYTFTFSDADSTALNGVLPP